jgi:predicted DNA-binding transcriptional regulator YafY
MRASRLLSILILLQVRGRLSAETLAREFEVSVRTIHRDIDQLSAAGVPVYAERGRSGGFALLEGYRTRLTGMSQAEAETLLLSGLGVAADDLGVGAAAAAAQLKLLASLPTDVGAGAQRVRERFHFDPVGWYGRSETLSHLPALAEAVWKGARVRFKYESWKAAVRREVDPLGLVLKAGAWYLVAAVDGKPRTYRVSNIREPEAVGGQMKRPARFDLARYWRDWLADFEARLLSERATVRISAAGLRLLRDVMPVAWEAATTKHKRARREGWVEAVIPVEAPQSAARQLLRLGAEVEVVGPAVLREAIKAEAAAVASLYRKPRA